jgi:PAS domain S-box-containing protein
VNFPAVDTTIVRTVTIASEPDYPPFCIIDKNGKADGFSVDLIKAAAKAVNLKINIKIGVWDIIRQDLEHGTVDALPLVGRTPERELIYDFSLPYITLHGAIFVRRGTTDIKSVADLKKKAIIVMKGDNAEEYVRRNNISDNVVITNTFSEAFRMLASGLHDAVITQRVMGIELLKAEKIKSIIPLDIQLNEFRQDFCFAVRKGDNKLLVRLNEGLSIIIANKTYDNIHLKWFGPVIKERLSTLDVIKVVLYTLIPLILIFFGASTLLLRREVRRKTKSLLQEISEHESAANALKNQQLLLAEMEKGTKVGGWEYDVEKKEFTWTNGVYAIYGISPDEYNIRGKVKDGPTRLYHPEDQKILDLAFKRALNEGKSYNLILRLNSSDGKFKWVRTAGNSVLRDGKVVRIIGNIIDITEQKQSEEELLKLKDDLDKLVTERTRELSEKIQKLDKSQKAMLYMVEDLNTVSAELKLEHQKMETANRELEAFSYSVSHDLRAPLRALAGFARILQEDYSKSLDKEGNRILEIIIENAKKMGTLIDDLLSFSRLSRQEIKLSLIDMHRMAKSVYEEIVPEEDKEKVEFRLQDIPDVQGDPSIVRQVWINLIGNAIKFTSTKQKRIIEVGFFKRDNENVYFVKDNGVGFDMAYRNKLFGVFQRLHNVKEFEGTGVGLAIVQRIILRLNGRVWAEGKVNEGAEFYFTLGKGENDGKIFNT